MKQRRNLIRAAATGAITTLILAAGCSAQPTEGADDRSIEYWLWDSAQQPGYQRCADQFEQQNPDLRIRIKQFSWDDYWSKLTAGFVADQAPDVFTNHLKQFPQYVDLDVLLPLDELEPTKGIKDSDYAGDLAELWKGQDGHRYGAPKDWDTVGYFYDKNVTDAAGITEEQLRTMTWNPDDGGSFEEIIAHLTVDKNGVRGDEPGFDKNNVQIFGLASEGAGGDTFGQTQWSLYTGSLPNWEPTDQNPWATKFRFDDPEFQKTVQWYFGLADKGYMPKYDTFGGLTGSYQQWAAGRAVLAPNGSWMISSFTSQAKADLHIAPTPVGPSGKRSSMFNGLADSITRFTDNPEGSARWVAYLSGAECQNIIAEAGVVFPARTEATERSLAVRKEAGLDVTAFTTHVDEGTTQLMPVTRQAADISALTIPQMEAIYTGKEDASSLTDLNAQLNSLLELTDS